MSHKVKKSLAGTSMEYFIVEGNEGLRVRKLSDSHLRIHIEEKAPEINSRNRLNGKDYKVTYWAADVNTKALTEAIGLAVGAEKDVEEDAGKEQVVAKFKGIENTLAQIVVEVGKLDDVTVSASAQIKEFEKIKAETASRKKKLLGLRQRLTNGMVAYRDAQDFLAE